MNNFPLLEERRYKCQEPSEYTNISRNVSPLSGSEAFLINIELAAVGIEYIELV